MNHCQGERARGGGGITRLERSGGEERTRKKKNQGRGEGYQERGVEGGVKRWRERGWAAEVEGGEEGRIKVRVKSGGFLE